MTERDFFFSLVPSGGNFIRFFPLLSSQSSLSLDVENERKSERDARARDGDDAISVRALLFFVFLERESERELKREKFLFFSPLEWVRSTETFVRSLVKRDTKKQLD